MHDEIHEAVRRGTLLQTKLLEEAIQEAREALNPANDYALEAARRLREKFWEQLPHSILEEAARLTSGPRQEAYDHPLHDFSRSVGAFNALFSEYLKKPLLPEHWGIIQILTKLSREVHCPKRDNLVDTAGYAECISLIHKEKEKGEKGGVG